MAIPLFWIGIGLALLLLGRRLFWLLVGASGFAAGFHLGGLFFGPQATWMLWVLALGCGIGGALLALIFQHLAVVVGGFLAGGSLALLLMPQLGFHGGGWVLVIGGLAGAAALLMLFDWALIVLSASLGAGFIIDAANWQAPYAALLFATLTAIGIACQARWLMHSRKRQNRP